MKRLFSLILILSCLLLSLSFFTIAQELPYHFTIRYMYYDSFREEGICVLRPEYNPNQLTEGNITISLKPTDIYNVYFTFPQTQISYHQPSTKISGAANISKFLKKNPSPKVIIRLPDKLEDAKFVESIELALSDLGWVILDHNLAKGLNSSAEIKKETGADLILYISWLKFSDPDMFTQINKSATSIAPFSADLRLSETLYFGFKNEKDYRKWSKSKNYEPSGRPVPLNDVNMSDSRDYIIDQISKYERFSTNKNVISAVFKLIDTSNNSILGYYHVGENQPYKVFGDKEIWCNIFSDRSTFYKEYKSQINDELIQAFLSYLDIYLPSGEISFAAQLNEMEDVKLSDETIKESYSSSSHTSGSYSAQSRDYYNSYFNSRYYSGRGRGYSSGHGSSTTNSSGSATTTFKDAEYIRYSDFFGYYKPLTEKFVEEIRKIQPK